MPSDEVIGMYVGSFLGAGLITALVAGILNLLLRKLIKNRSLRLALACFTVPVLSLFVHADGPTAWALYFIAGVLVFFAFLANPEKQSIS